MVLVLNEWQAAARAVHELDKRHEGLWEPILKGSFHDVSHSNHVVGGGSEGEHPTDSFAASVFGLAQASRRLDPAKDLFDELTFLLA